MWHRNGRRVSLTTNGTVYLGPTFTVEGGIVNPIYGTQYAAGISGTSCRNVEIGGDTADCIAASVGFGLNGVDAFDGTFYENGVHAKVVFKVDGT